MPPLDDIDRIMAVMDVAFDPAFGEAWNRSQLEGALVMGNCHYGLIARTGGAPEKGTAASGFFLSRHGFEDEELLLFAIDPSTRWLGLGGRLLESFITEARARGAMRLFLEMRQGNPAEHLYRRFGFVPVGRRPRYYRAPDGSRIDAITFALDCFADRT